MVVGQGTKKEGEAKERMPRMNVSPVPMRKNQQHPLQKLWRVAKENEPNRKLGPRRWNKRKGRGTRKYASSVG